MECWTYLSCLRVCMTQEFGTSKRNYLYESQPSAEWVSITRNALNNKKKENLSVLTESFHMIVT